MEDSAFLTTLLLVVVISAVTAAVPFSMTFPMWGPFANWLPRYTAEASIPFVSMMAFAVEAVSACVGLDFQETIVNLKKAAGTWKKMRIAIVSMVVLAFQHKIQTHPSNATVARALVGPIVKVIRESLAEVIRAIMVVFASRPTSQPPMAHKVVAYNAIVVKQGRTVSNTLETFANSKQRPTVAHRMTIFVPMEELVEIKG